MQIKFDVTVATPRRCGRQTARENHPGDTAEVFYRRSLAVPFLDHLKSELDSRFTSHAILAMKCLSIIPSCFSCEVTNDDEILEFFSSDIEYLSTAKAELALWQAYFKDQEIEELPDTPELSLKHATPMLFPSIQKMLIHIMVLPVTSCEAERSFSALRRIKTFLRTTMTQDRLNGLALLNVYNSTSYLPSAEEIRTEFLKRNRRLMETTNI